MTDPKTQRKWDQAAALFDVMGGFGPERRWREAKTRLFSAMDGRNVFVAVGTGLDIPCFPLGRRITGIDICPRMLKKAKLRADVYAGNMNVRHMDVHDMDFPVACFDQVYTSCTFCSVPDPVKGLEALHRLLKPGGRLTMFERTGSRIFPFSLMMNAMNPLCRMVGPEINRDTVANVRAAGFKIHRVTNIYLDVVKTIEATAPVPNNE